MTHAGGGDSSEKILDEQGGLLRAHSSVEENYQEDQIGLSTGEGIPIKKMSYTKILDRPLPRLTTLEPLSLPSDDRSMQESGSSYLDTLLKLEHETGAITEDLSQLLKYLQARSYEVTDASTKCLDVLKLSLDDTCSVVDESIKMIYRLIAKCDEIMKSLEIIDKFREDVRSLKKVLDIFENTFKLKSSQYQLQKLKAHSQDTH